jgi:hypothetical protein
MSPRSSPSRLRVVLGIGLLGFSALLVAQTSADESSRTKGVIARCTPDDFTLCFNEGRFRVTADFQLTPAGPSMRAHAVPLTDQSGGFWFFDASNIELIVKLLNGCQAPFNTYWVFVAGLTNVGVVITAVDLPSGTTQRYTNEIGSPFVPVQDTHAFNTCP